MKMKAEEFLARHGMSPERIDPVQYAPRMAESMAEGLAAEGCMLPMIPTYLKNSGAVPQGAQLCRLISFFFEIRCVA